MSTKLLEQLLTEKDKQQLQELCNTLEEILDTLYLLLDREALSRLREAEEDFKTGKTRNWQEFIEEYRKLKS